ncbi:uncharacterized protein LOC103956471 [Pyrus x bretschneideri]|uniref:uncharacterized protein LOC103956471 n=1 Tax=Pyrus x bretschneideri TaxID=225117 RepID=UPI002030E477|nr:uncharacterized protein LOC103956471 [Pyrus x bretschneideri]
MALPNPKENQMLMEYSAPTMTTSPSCIVRPQIAANNFELKPSFIQMMLSFYGLLTEDPNLHINEFLEICDTLKIHNMTDEAIRLCLFQFSLKDKVETWLQFLPPNSITTWNDLASKFLQKLFPPSKTAKLRNDIMTFAQFHRMTNAASGGALMTKTVDEASAIFNTLSANSQSWGIDRKLPKKAGYTFKYRLSYKQFFPEFIQEQANQVNNFNHQQFDPFSDKYNPSWRHHPNFAWKNNQQNHVNPFIPFQNHEAKKNSMEDMMAQLAQTTNTLAQNTNNFMQATQTSLQNQQASMRKLEEQVGQSANAMVEREKGKFPSQTEINPKNQEQVKAITLRSGKILEKKSEGKVDPVEKLVTSITKPQEEEQVHKKKVSPPISYPQRLQKAKKDQHFSDIFELFKRVNINIPLLDAVKQILRYAKIFKDVCTKKKRFAKHETVMLSEECCVVLQKKLPPELKDPGSFTIPCTIGNTYFDKSLCDLDFVVLDMEEDREIPIILGRPFLATADTVIEVRKDLVTLRVQGEHVVFKVFEAIKCSNEAECFEVNFLNKEVNVDVKSNAINYAPLLIDLA